MDPFAERSMNAIALVILIALAADSILQALADALNLKSAGLELPLEFQGHYDAARYRKSQQYLRAKTYLGWIALAVNLLALLIFWFARGFPLLDHWVRSWHQGAVLSGLIFIGILLLLRGVLALPFSIYATFVIEERFGFNRTTIGTYSLDLLKGVLLAILLGVPLLAGFLAFFEYAGANAWWYCWIAASLYLLALQFVAPTWILPLFNKFTPLDRGKLKAAILAYAASINFPVENVYVMDGSRRSGKSNAFFAGFGRHRRIVLLDTLLPRHSIAELVAVLAHEMGHYKKKHIHRMLIFEILQTGLVLFLLSFFISYQGLFDAFYMPQKSVYAGLIFFALLYSPLELVSGIFVRMLSRKNETQADRFAVETTGGYQAMADALKKLASDNLSNLTPHPLYVWLNYSHPPVLQRIQAINEWSGA